MKSIHDVRRENLIDLINRDFDGTQSRLAERMGTQQNLLSRWVTGKKNIGDQAARKIEAAARKATNWMDLDRSMSADNQLPSPEEMEIGILVARNLAEWMSNNRELSSQGKLSKASGIAQSTINRIMNNEASPTVGTLEALAVPFGRKGYELLMHPDDPAIINYDHARYGLLPPGEKDKIKSFIDFVLIHNNKNQE